MILEGITMTTPGSVPASVEVKSHTMCFGLVLMCPEIHVDDYTIGRIYWVSHPRNFISLETSTPTLANAVIYTRTRATR